MRRITERKAGGEKCSKLAVDKESTLYNKVCGQRSVSRTVAEKGAGKGEQFTRLKSACPFCLCRRAVVTYKLALQEISLIESSSSVK